MTGEELYVEYQKAMLEGGVLTDDFEVLEMSDKESWNALADKVEWKDAL